MNYIVFGIIGVALIVAAIWVAKDTRKW